MGSSKERVGPLARGDHGAALVEFALVASMLFMLIFGILHFGLILSFDQDMTRAAAEGARAGAVAFPASDAQTEADAATKEAVKAFGGGWTGPGCSRAGMTCSVPPPAPCAASNPTGPQCITVTLTYQYDQFPLFGEMPIIGGLFEPDEIKAESVARINE